MSDKPAYNPASKLFSALLGGGLIVVGVMFLLGRTVGDVFHIDIGHFTWPFFIIIPGGLLFLASFVFERKAGVVMAIFGAMAAMAGAILLVQNTFDLYATWSYAWALVAPTSMGLAKFVYGLLRGVGDEVKSGLTLTGVGLGIFVFAASFFEGVIGISGFHFGLTRYFLPVMLIGFGVIVLVASLLPRRSQASA